MEYDSDGSPARRNQTFPLYKEIGCLVGLCIFFLNISAAIRLSRQILGGGLLNKHLSMKKELLTLACLAGLGLTASATDFTDVLTLEEAQIAAAMDGQEVNGYWDTGHPDFAWFGESGIEYRIGGVVDDEDGGMQFYYGGFVATNDNPDGLYLKSVKFLSDDGTVYGRTTPVEYHLDGDTYVPNVGGYFDYSDWSYITYPGNTYLDQSSYGYYVAEEPFPYVVISPNSGTSYHISGIEITWTDQPVVPQVKTPSISINSDYYTQAIPTGTSVSMSCATNDATIHYTVSINGAAAQEFTGTAGTSSAEYVMVGNAGDVFAFTCWATKDGYTDSEIVTKEATLTLPGLEAPTGDISEYAWFDCILGRTGTISNPNEDGIGTIVYTINDGEEQESTATSVQFVIEGEIGSMFTVSAYIKCEGYNNSPVVTMSKEIKTNKLNAPYFEPGDGAEVQAGKQIRIASNQAYMCKGFKYRINEGEWIVAEGEDDVRFNIEADCTVEAQMLANTEGSYSYYIDSDIVSASYTLEVINENMYVLIPAVFGFTGSTLSDHAEYTAELNGVTFEAKTGMNSRNYFDWGGGSSFGDHICNLDPMPQGIQRIKTEDNYNKAMVVFLSDTPILDNGWSLYNNFSDDMNNAVVIESADNGLWVNLAEYDEENGTEFAGKQYMLIRPYDIGGWSATTRIIFDTNENPTVGVENIEAETALADGIYNLNGIVVKNDRLAKGIYVKVANGKASKMIVK